LSALPDYHTNEEFVLSKSACHQTGVYIAYPASPVLKSINKSNNHTTMVNDQHTKLGISKGSFLNNKKEHRDNFDNEVDFIPVATIGSEYLGHIEAQIISAIQSEFQKVEQTNEWFDTSDRQRILEIISNTLATSGIEYQYIARPR
jgi:hypothetical protein